MTIRILFTCRILKALLVPACYLRLQMEWAAIPMAELPVCWLWKLSPAFLFPSLGIAPFRKPYAVELSWQTLQVYQKAQQLGAGRMGTTLTAVYIFGNTLYLTHVGDSRAYLIRDKRATCLSADHTTVGDMVRSKLLSPDKLRTHAQRSVLTKAIGISLFVQPDITEHRLQEGDRLVLCSDGVWSVVQDEDFARIASNRPRWRASAGSWLI